MTFSLVLGTTGFGQGTLVHHALIVLLFLFCFVFHTLQYTIFLRSPQKGREARKESKFHLWGLKYEKKFLKNKKYTKIQD